MKSLKTRLTLAAVVAAILITGLTGGLLYTMIQEDMENQLDESLLDRARAQAALVEFDEEGLQFEWEHSPGLVEVGALPRYFQVRELGGKRKLLVHSAGLPDADFEYPVPFIGQEAAHADAVLPAGVPARTVSLIIYPKLDDEVDADANIPALLLIVAEPTEELDETLQRFQLMFGGAGLGGLLIAILLLRLILWRELKPVNELAGKISQLDADDLSKPIEVARAPAELQPVIEQLNALLARVHDTLRREHEFTAGAAHELRTPLAGLRGKLELALSRERTPEQHRDFQQSSLEITLQMQSLVENLLALARAGAAAETPVEIDIREALRSAWKPHAEAAEKRGLKVDWEFVGEKSSLPANALQLVAGNLFENAVSYTNEGGRIEIAAEVADGKLRLEVANTGCTLRPDQREQVFEPFWRGDSVRAIGSHAGLGLSICRRVARKHGGDISVQIINDKFVATLEL